MFAWTGQTSVPWPVSVVAFFLAYVRRLVALSLRQTMADLACSTCQLQLGTFCIYSGVFNYIADAFVKSLVRKTLPDSLD
jgi:membrane protein implicated in regulation of membrane protease activity